MANDSADEFDEDDTSEYSVDNVMENVMAINEQDDGAAAAENGTDDEGVLDSVNVEPVNPKSFRQSPYSQFVPPEKWEACEKDDQEASYVLEEVRQRLLGLCAPGKGNWKVHPITPAARFLPLPVSPLSSKSGFVTPAKIHGVMRIPRQSVTEYQSVGSEGLLMKVIFGNPNFDICGNRNTLSKVGVNFQLDFPPKCIFRIRNTDYDEVVLYYSSRDDDVAMRF